MMLNIGKYQKIFCFSACYYDYSEHANKPLTKIPEKWQGCTMHSLFLIGSVMALNFSEFTAFFFFFFFNVPSQKKIINGPASSFKGILLSCELL